MNRLRPRRLRSRLFIVLIVALGAAVAFVAVAWQLVVVPTVRSGVGKRYEAVARSAAIQIDAFIRRRTAVLAVTAEVADLPATDAALQRDALFRLLKLDAVIQEVFLADTTGRTRRHRGHR